MLFSVVVLIQGPHAQAFAKPQSPALAPKVQPQPEEQHGSWLFILETKTQWALIIQDSPDSAPTTSDNSIFDPLIGNGNNGSGSGTGTGTGTSNSNSSHFPPSNTSGATQTGPEKTGKPSDSNWGNIIIFEGNTEDGVPTPPPTKPKPSAPSS